MQNEMLNELASLMNHHIATSDKFSDRDRACVGEAVVEGEAIILTGTKFRNRPETPITARLVEHNGKTWMQFSGFYINTICGQVFQGVRAAHPELKYKAGQF